MTSRVNELAAILALSAGLLGTPGAHAQGITVPAPPPPVVLATPPHFAVVRGSRVMHAPAVDFNLFAFEGRYYSFHNGAWFHASSHRGPWAITAVDRLPSAVRAVPVAYYKIPPGHAKRMMEKAERPERQGGGPGRDKGPKGK